MGFLWHIYSAAKQRDRFGNKVIAIDKIRDCFCTILPFPLIQNNSYKPARQRTDVITSVTIHFKVSVSPSPHLSGTVFIGKCCYLL